MLVAVSVLIGAPAFGQAGLLDPGARRFATTCSGCHGLDGSGSAKGSAIAKLPAVIARSDDELVAIVHNGVPGKGMPAMKALGDDSIRAVVRYLRTLQGVSGTVAAAKSNANTEATTGDSARVQTGSSGCFAGGYEYCTGRCATERFEPERDSGELGFLQRRLHGPAF